jgi:hypothetical protein
VPASSRWVAKLCRKVCTVTGFVMARLWHGSPPSSRVVVWVDGCDLRLTMLQDMLQGLPLPFLNDGNPWN